MSKVFFGEVLMMIQLSPLYIDRIKKLCNIKEDNSCVLRSQSVDSTGSLGVYSIGSFPTVPTIAPEIRLKGETVLMTTKLPIATSYVSTVHFPLHYFPTFFVHRQFLFSGSACSTISGRGRS
jgi:hypothetical protein